MHGLDCVAALNEYLCSGYRAACTALAPIWSPFLHVDWLRTKVPAPQTASASGSRVLKFRARCSVWPR